MRTALAGIASVIALGGGSGSQLGAPTWSPDGAHVAWVGDSTVWVSSADGSHAHPLHHFDGVGQLAWGGSSSLLVDSNFRYFRLRLDGHASMLGSAFDMTFSTDAAGRRLAAGTPGCPRCTGSVQILNLRSNTVVKVGSARESNSTPALSPDGARVAYTRHACDPGGGECGHGLGVWIAAASGRGAAHRLVGHGTCPVWAPSGQTIAFIDVLGQGLQVIPAAGGTAVVLERRVGCNTSYPPSFSPDSTQLAYVDARDRLAVYDLSKHRVVFRSTTARVIGQTWARDGRSLIIAQRPSDVGCSSLWRVYTAGGLPAPFRRCD